MQQADDDTNWMNEIAERKRRRTEKVHIVMKKCADLATVLNFKQVNIEVCDGLVIEGGIFSASYPTYKINTTASGISYEVRRKDSDFYFLRKHLLRGFPHLIVPPCPKDGPKLITDRIKRREKYYTRFLQAISRCEELKTSKFLLTFLSECDIKEFQKVVKEAYKIKEHIKSRPFNDLVTLTGSAKVVILPNSACQKFCTNLSDIAENYQILWRETISCSKELSEKAMDFAATFQQLQRLMTQMSEHQRRIQCTTQAVAFEQIAKVMTSSGIYVKNLGEIIRKNLADHMKYNLHEGDTFRDLFTYRDTLFHAYSKADKTLQEKKEKLFKLRDLTKWGCDANQVQDMMKNREALFKNRESAFELMLPKETQELEIKR